MNLESFKGSAYTAIDYDSSIYCLKSSDFLDWQISATIPSMKGTVGMLNNESSLFIYSYTLPKKINHLFQSPNGKTWTPIPLPSESIRTLSINKGSIICSTDSTVYIKSLNDSIWQKAFTSDEKIYDTEINDLSTILVATEGSIYITTNLGQIWDTLPTPYPLTGQQNSTVKINILDSVYFLSHRIISDKYLYRSSDNGISWKQIDFTDSQKEPYLLDLLKIGTNYWGVFENALAHSSDQGNTWTIKLSPRWPYQIENIGDTIVLGSTTGLHISSDTANSWETANPNWEFLGVKNTYFSGVFPDYKFLPANNKFFISNHNELHSTEDDGSSFKFIDNQGSYYSIFEKEDTILLIGKSLFLSKDGGVSWIFHKNSGVTSPLYGTSKFINIGNHIFSHDYWLNKVHTSEDWGLTWTPIAETFDNTKSIATDGNSLFLLTEKEVYKSDNSGQTFIPFNDGLQSNLNFNYSWSTKGQAFLQVNKELYRQTKLGWELSNEGLADFMDEYTIINNIHGEGDSLVLSGYLEPSNTTKIYLSTNGGKSWNGGLETGLPQINNTYLASLYKSNIYVMGISFEDNRTHLWKQEFAVSTDEKDIEYAEMDIFPNPGSDYFWLIINEPYPNGELIIHDLTGRVVFTKRVEGEKEIKMELTGVPAGQYWVTWNSKDGRSLRSPLLVHHP